MAIMPQWRFKGVKGMTTQAEEYGLKPCPFCGSTRLLIGVSESDSPNPARDIEYIECSKCGAQGPWHRVTKSHSRVISDWNKRSKTDNFIHELLIVMEMKYQILGSNLVYFLDDRFDPDAYYTPCENAMYRIYEHLGFNRYDIVREAYKRLTEEAER